MLHRPKCLKNFRSFRRFGKYISRPLKEERWLRKHFLTKSFLVRTTTFWKNILGAKCFCRKKSETFCFCLWETQSEKDLRTHYNSSKMFGATMFPRLQVPARGTRRYKFRSVPAFRNLTTVISVYCGAIS